MESWAVQNFANCQLGDKRLNSRALEIGKVLVAGFGQALSMLFQDKNLLKRTYEFFANSKVQLTKLTQPHWEKTATDAQALKVLLANVKQVTIAPLVKSTVTPGTLIF